MKIEISEEDLTQLAQLTNLSSNEMVNLLHSVWLDGYRMGEADAYYKITEIVGRATGTVYLEGNESLAAQLRKPYQDGRTRMERAKNERENNKSEFEQAKDRVRKVFALARKIVVEWERS